MKMTKNKFKARKKLSKWKQKKKCKGRLRERKN